MLPLDAAPHRPHAQEAPIHENIKQAMVKASEGQTTLVMRSLRNTERVYKNKTALTVQEAEAKAPGDINAIRHLVKGENYRKSFQVRAQT